MTSTCPHLTGTIIDFNIVEIGQTVHVSGMPSTIAISSNDEDVSLILPDPPPPFLICALQHSGIANAMVVCRAYGAHQ